MKVVLKDLCDFINGGAWSDKEYVPKGIPVIKVSNLKNEGIDLSNQDFIAKSSLEKYKKHILKGKDLVIATVGSHPSLVNSAAGRASIIPDSFDGFLLNQNAVCIRSKDEKILSQSYLSYLGKTPLFQHFIQQRGRGAANQMRIAISSIKEFEFILPPLPTQRHIASILSAYDDLIENNLKRIKLLEELAQRTYEEWFVRFTIKGKKLEVDEKTGLPEGWERKSIGESCNVSGGGTPSRKIAEYWSDGIYNWYSPSDLTKLNTLYVEESSEKINDLGLKKSSAKLLDSNSFMMTSRATIGVFAVTDSPFCTNQGFINITPHKKNQKAYLLYTLQHRIEEFKGYATGATFPELSKSKFKTIEIIWPTNNTLSVFQDFIDPIHNKIIHLNKQNRLLREARDILLPRLMNGTISIDN